jgi:hypothetical protein
MVTCICLHSILYISFPVLLILFLGVMQNVFGTGKDTHILFFPHNSYTTDSILSILFAFFPFVPRNH